MILFQLLTLIQYYFNYFLTFIDDIVNGESTATRKKSEGSDDFTLEDSQYYMINHSRTNHYATNFRHRQNIHDINNNDVTIDFLPRPGIAESTGTNRKNKYYGRSSPTQQQLDHSHQYNAYPSPIPQPVENLTGEYYKKVYEQPQLVNQYRQPYGQPVREVTNTGFEAVKPSHYLGISSNDTEDNNYVVPPYGLEGSPTMRDDTNRKRRGIKGTTPLIDINKGVNRYDMVTHEDTSATRKVQRKSSKDQRGVALTEMERNSFTSTESESNPYSEAVSGTLSNTSPISKRTISMPLLRKEDFALYNLIGGGGFGQVWRGEWHGTPVAVKLLSNVNAANRLPDQLMNSFTEEVDMIARLRHPNICLFLGVCLEQSHMAIVTELVSRGSLWDVLRVPGLFQQQVKSRFVSPVTASSLPFNLSIFFLIGLDARLHEPTKARLSTQNPTVG